MQAHKATKKPIEIEWFQFKNTDYDNFPEWFNENVSWRFDNDGITYFIETLEGILHITNNDIIIKGIKGEIYPCKPDIFVSTYSFDNDIVVIV